VTAETILNQKEKSQFSTLAKAFFLKAETFGLVN